MVSLRLPKLLALIILIHIVLRDFSLVSNELKASFIGVTTITSAITSTITDGSTLRSSFTDYVTRREPERGEGLP